MMAQTRQLSAIFWPNIQCCLGLSVCFASRSGPRIDLGEAVSMKYFSLFSIKIRLINDSFWYSDRLQKSNDVIVPEFLASLRWLYTSADDIYNLQVLLHKAVAMEKKGLYGSLVFILFVQGYPQLARNN